MRYQRPCLSFAITAALLMGIEPGGPPTLTIRPDDLTNDIIVKTSRLPAVGGIEEPIYSAPVSLTQTTNGLISGDTGGGFRGDDVRAVENERRITAEMARSLKR
jgi:hypothetical protein